MNEIVNSTNTKSQAINSISLGAMVLVIASFGLTRHLGWESVFSWFDCGLFAASLGMFLNYVLNKAILQGLLFGALPLGIIGFRHELFRVDSGVVFFGLLLLVGGSLVVKGVIERK